MAKLSEWVKTAQPGDKVVALRGNRTLKVGGIYTIKAIHPPIKADFGIEVVEARPARPAAKNAYQACIFRPAPSIKVFTDLLTKEPRHNERV